MHLIQLPNIFRPKCVVDLKRLGKANDGGYVVDSASIAEADFLLSLGISDDWSFEKDFLSQKNVGLIAFDGSIGGTEFFKSIIKSLALIHRMTRHFKAIATLLNYLLFFRHNRIHVKKFCGPDTFTDHISLKRIFEDYVPDDHRNIFLKMDIEGGEYRILNELIHLQSRLVGCVIEFHDCDLHEKRIADFIEDFELQLCHIHSNNWGHVTPNKKCQFLEVSFSRAAAAECPTELNVSLDEPNNPHRHDHTLVFS